MIADNKFTKEQVDILLLQQNISNFSGTFKRIDDTLNKLEFTMQKNFHWTMGAIFGLYGIVISAMLAALGKAYGVF
jgi:tetrahydromethanopterin S-methyltransferase subunit G